MPATQSEGTVTRPIVELCVHGEAKPHQVLVRGPVWAAEPPDYESIYQDCPGGRVLEQADLEEALCALGVFEIEMKVVGFVKGDTTWRYVTKWREPTYKSEDALASAQENQ